MLKRKISAKDKIEEVKLYRKGNISQKGLADSYASAQQWIRKYESMGTETF